MRTVKIKGNINNLEALKKRLSQLDPEKHKLFFEDKFELDLKWFTFKYEGDDQVYVIEDVQYEENEIPLLAAIRQDVTDYIPLDDSAHEVTYIEETDTCEVEEGEENKPSYYTMDERGYDDFYSSFENHSDWNFIPGGRYAWNIPGIPNGTLIGFYWIPLTAVIDDLKSF